MDAVPVQGGVVAKIAARIGPATALVTLAGFIFSGVLTALYFPLLELRIAPNPTFDLVDFLIDISPGALATWAIEIFGHSGKVLLTAGGVAIWMLAGGVIAGLGTRIAGPDSDSRLGWVASGLIHAFAALVIEIEAGALEGGFFGVLIVLLTSMVWGYASHRIPQGLRLFRSRGSLARRRLRSNRERISRRAAISAVSAWAVAGSAASMAGWVGVRSLKGTRVSTNANENQDLILPGFDPGFPLPSGIRPLITSNRDFYRVDINTRTPEIDPDLWRLRVHGRVENELRLSYSEILEMQPLEIYGTLQCISNEVGGNLIGTTLWKGLSLGHVLSLARPLPDAVDVTLVAEGGYNDSIPISKALEPETLLAYSMNGVSLSAAHGFPLRAYIPNIYGMKNVKWLTEVKVEDVDHQGYWQQRGWSDIAIVKTTSAFDPPRSRARYPTGPNSIGGIAYAGSRGISAVEVEADGNGLWVPADLERSLAARTWRRWSFKFVLAPGRHNLTVRAFDGGGSPQESADTATHPDGAGGYHRIRISVDP